MFIRVERERFLKAAEEKGHVLRRDEDGDVDFFALDADVHNGPLCERCGESWCWHCTSADEIKQCISDEELEAREEEKKRRVSLRKSAADKLTEDEREAVGLDNV